MKIAEVDIIYGENRGITGVFRRKNVTKRGSRTSCGGCGKAGSSGKELPAGVFEGNQPTALSRLLLLNSQVPAGAKRVCPLERVTSRVMTSC